MISEVIRPVIVGLALTTLFSFPISAAGGDTPKPGTLLVVAGTGEAGFGGDGGPAPQAKLNAPHGVAMDAAGNLFIADQLNNRVRKVSPDGTITTVAGGGVKGPRDADGGPASEARLNSPQDVVLDGAGNLYITDPGQARVRRVSPDGIIITYAGNGKSGYSGDNGPATDAMMDAAINLAVDAAGNLYIAERDSSRVRKVGPDGVIITVAGTGQPGFSGDGGPAGDAQLDAPHGLAVDADGNLYISDTGNRRIRKIDRNGNITSVAGTGVEGFSGDGGPATATPLSSPDGLAVDTAGNLFIADLFSHRVRKVSPQGIITTVAGSGQEEFSGAGGPATAAGLRGPFGLVVDAAGNLFISDSASSTGRQDGLGDGERVLRVVGAAAPGLLAGRPFPRP